MPRLSQIMKKTREALGVSQKQLAERVKISQSAIAQFERSESKLSRDKLLQIAPFLNLNPLYIQEGIGNIFKNLNKEEAVIEMTLPSSIDDQLDFSIIDFIGESNDKVRIIFLQLTGLIEAEGDRIRKWRHQDKVIFALVIEDADENLFFIKKKDGSFLNDKEIIHHFRIRSLPSGKSTMIDFAYETISHATFKMLQADEPVARTKEIKNIALGHASRDQRRFLVESIKQAALIDRITNEEEDRMMMKIRGMNTDRLKSIYEDVIQQIILLLKKNI